MAAPKPTIILVPGAWHPATAYQPTTNLLEAAGYTCVGVDLASYGADPPLENFDKDIEVIRSAVKAEVDADRDVVVVMHSYASVPGGEAVKGLDKASVRKDGGRGGVAHLVYCTAFAPPKGASLMGMLGGQDLPWFIVSSDKKIVNPQDPKAVFYNDMSDEQAESAVASLKTHSYATFSSETTWEPWRTIPSTYIFCTEDRAIPLQVQKGMCGGKEAGWAGEATVQGASHSPFISQPGVTAEAIRRAAGEEVVSS